MIETEEMARSYRPAQTESKVASLWEQAGLFTPHIDPSRPRFSMVMPPPNVTGQLHVGHAQTFTMQDVLARFHRMCGEETLWVPGTDHAGIATQAKVEEQLAKQGRSRKEIGREAFVAEVWQWKERYHARIVSQLRRVGVSADWSRERFTLDEGLSTAVRHAFVRLYQEGLIYRGNYIVNWCPHCRTAISDIEVDHVSEKGTLYRIAYPYLDGTGTLVVATTRPETLFGDVAVAVHPQDARYRSVVGRSVHLPLTDRVLPVIADSYVDREYGTGAVKITPAHDPNDFAVGERHGLQPLFALDEEARLTPLAGRFSGMSREEAREAVVVALSQEGLLVGEEEIEHAVGHCSRCGTVVEPRLSLQWYVRTKPLADVAAQAVRTGRTQLLPQRFTKVFLNWMEEIHDWCISRQLWWGHRIPAYTCTSCGELVVAEEAPTRCDHCGNEGFNQDPDVLDTWFSSALWPMSVLGWPQQTPDFQRYFPTDVLVTGYDILFFWVARMMMMSLHFTGEVPFRKVFLHGLIRDAQGRKMSKSLGNGVDPIEVIDRFGADALRFSLLHGVTSGNDTRFSQERVEAARNFANKVWNAARFVHMTTSGYPDVLPAWENLGPAERFLLDRLNGTIEAVTQHFQEGDFGAACERLYRFIWDEFCDWFVEWAKTDLYGSDPARRETMARTLRFGLDQLLRLLHPVMPFLTEEIWCHFPHQEKLLAGATWPTPEREWEAPVEVVRMQQCQELVRQVRTLRSMLTIPPKRTLRLAVQESSQTPPVTALAYCQRLANVTVEPFDADKPAPPYSLPGVAMGISYFVEIGDAIDPQDALARLQDQEKQCRQELARAEKKLANPGFVQQAPSALVEAEKEKRDRYAADLQRIQQLEQEILAWPH